MSDRFLAPHHYLPHRCWSRTHTQVFDVVVVDQREGVVYVRTGAEEITSLPFEDVTLFRPTHFCDEKRTSVYEGDIIQHEGIGWVVAYCYESASFTCYAFTEGGTFLEYGDFYEICDSSCVVGHFYDLVARRYWADTTS